MVGKGRLGNERYPFSLLDRAHRLRTLADSQRPPGPPAEAMAKEARWQAAEWAFIERMSSAEFLCWAWRWYWYGETPSARLHRLFHAGEC